MNTEFSEAVACSVNIEIAEVLLYYDGALLVRGVTRDGIQVLGVNYEYGEAGCKFYFLDPGATLVSAFCRGEADLLDIILVTSRDRFWLGECEGNHGEVVVCQAMLDPLTAVMLPEPGLKLSQENKT